MIFYNFQSTFLFYIVNEKVIEYYLKNKFRCEYKRMKFQHCIVTYILYYDVILLLHSFILKWDSFRSNYSFDFQEISFTHSCFLIPSMLIKSSPLTAFELKVNDKCWQYEKEEEVSNDGFRIIGGFRTRINKYPWQVSEWQCWA